MVIVVNAFSARQGGGLVYIINFLKHFSNEEIKLIILCGSYNEAIFREASGKKQNMEIKVLNFGTSLLKRSFWEMFVLRKYLKQCKADYYYAPGGTMCTITPRNCRSMTALRNMLPFDKKERLRYPFFSFLRWKLFLLQIVFLLSYRLADKVIFISEYSYECVKSLYPAIQGKARVIPHGLNEQFKKDVISPFDLEKYSLQPGEFYLYVSRLDVYKAQLEIVDEWKTLVDNGFRFPLILAGETDGEYGVQVQEKIKTLGLSDYVRCIGPVPYAQIPSLYKAARALVFASSCECCPNILLEMMSSGKPVFASDIPPMPEFGGPDAVYFNPYEKGELTGAILSAENNYPEMCEKGRKIKERSQMYDWDQTVKKTLDFLIN